MEQARWPVFSAVRSFASGKIFGTAPEPSPPAISYLDLLDLREESRSFVGLAGYHDDGVTLTGAGEAARADATLATADYFDILGLEPLLGRGFAPEEDRTPGGAPVVVLGYGLWKDRFGESAKALGSTLEINLHPYTIVGVAPAGFQGAKTGIRSDLWIPLSMAQPVWGRSNSPVATMCGSTSSGGFVLGGTRPRPGGGGRPGCRPGPTLSRRASGPVDALPPLPLGLAGGR